MEPKTPLNPERLDRARKLLDELADCRLAFDFLNKYEEFSEKCNEDEEPTQPCLVVTNDYNDDTASVNIGPEIARGILTARLDWLRDELAKLEIYM